MNLRLSTFAILLLLSVSVPCPAQENFAGADEKTPSHSEFFSWINNTNEGATEANTMANLEFFRYLKETYGMRLDIYAFDAGAIDGSKRYGSMKSADFRKQFPRGFGPLADFAAKDGTRLGLWCGPDGFGDTDDQARERSEMMVSLVRDFDFGLFKMDAVCGQLRPSKYDWFEGMMSQIRAMSPDFVLLNHRLELGPGTKYSTTYLYGGAETYIDVHMSNNVTAPHHRVEAIARDIPPTRLTEDHGVCISSCLDYWDDDLILQAFNRNLILAPEVYGNPWLLSDDEYSQLAFIFNLHRDYRDILVNGTALPEEKYGPNAISRGDGKTRFLTLRNLSWEPVTYKIAVSEELGLDKAPRIQARMYHPYVEDLGSHSYGSSMDVTVLPFRSCLIKLTGVPEEDRVAVSGIPYRIVNDRVGDSCVVRLLGNPGETYRYEIRAGKNEKSGKISFPGRKLKESPFRKIAVMEECPVPGDAEAIYYSTVFAADNNALEVRSLNRSGETAIPQVKAARDAFFGQDRFRERGIWDRNLFDGDENTFFNVAFRWGDFRLGDNSILALDLGGPTVLDSLVFTTDTEYSISPMRLKEGTHVYVSNDFREWKELLMVNELRTVLDMRDAGAVRYLRFEKCPIRIAEITGFRGGAEVCRESWRASNLFAEYDGNIDRASRAWKAEFTLDEIPANSYLCVAVNGCHGEEGAWAGFKVDGEYVGCPDRAPSFLANTWECPVRRRDSNYTYYLPLTEDMKGKRIEAFVLQMREEEGLGDLNPEIRMSVYPLPFESADISLPMDNRSSWMASVPDEVRVGTMSIPGAHDACTANVCSLFSYFRTQALDIQEQWDAGVRAFDLRPTARKDHLGVFHQIADTHVSFDEVIDVLADNLQRHPSEFAVVFFRHEDDADLSDNFKSLMGSYLNKGLPEGLAVDFRKDMTLGGMRGHIMFLGRSGYDDGPVGGYIEGWPDNAEVVNSKGERIPIDVQDHYAPEGRDDKLNAIIGMLEKNASNDRWSVNHCSAYVKSGYGENSQNINSDVADYISCMKGKAGIVMMDFAGTDRYGKWDVSGRKLVNAVIRRNFGAD